MTATPVIQERVSITPALARRIEIWPVDRLVPYSRNARTHSAEKVAQIAASIVAFGFNAPILVDSHAGIGAGHGRLLAARKLGLPEVPGVVLDHFTDTQRRAYIIADNKLSDNAGWDEEILANYCTARMDPWTRMDPETTRVALAGALHQAKRNKTFENSRFIGLASDGTGAGHTYKEPCALCDPVKDAN
jgi:hypothetical protein